MVSPMKFKAYRSGDLEGLWSAALKIDGVPAFFTEDGVYSKSGKPLYNLDHLGLTEGIYEVYLGSWEESVSAVRTKVGGTPKPIESLYRLDVLDERLEKAFFLNPTEEEIFELLEEVISDGYEGLILSSAGKVGWKVKGSHTIDIRVTGVLEGSGKYTNMIGALQTDYGKVGTGLKDKDRLLDPSVYLGNIIEVEFMEWTPNGKMRHPRFKRLRVDKDNENLEATQI